MIRTLILDFDGTLADSRNCIVATIHDTLRHLGLPPVTPESIVACIGLPLDVTFIRVAGISGNRLTEACEYYLQRFDELCPDMVTLFPGVADTLTRLHSHGIGLTIASNRGNASLNLLLHQLGIDHLFQMTCGAETTLRKKPEPDIVLHILSATGTPAAGALVVGDTSFDIAMGRGAGCHTCGVTYGNQTRTELTEAGADHVIDAFDGLITIVQHHSNPSFVTGT